MTVITRDAWSDAHQAATAEVLGRDVATVRRRIWLRRALGIVLGAGILGAGLMVLDLVVDDSFVEPLWAVPAAVRHAGLGLAVAGLVLMLVGNARASSQGVSRPFVGPDDFLSRADRAWLRVQIAEGRPVPAERHAVVTAAARQMVGEALFPSPDLGLALLFVGMIIGSPYVGTVAPFSVFTACVLLRALRAAVWARRAQRWLALNA